MTLKEMKQRTFSLIEEYDATQANLAEDEDVINKINGIVNSIMLDLMPYRRIPANIEIEVTSTDDKIIDLTSYISNLYQINKIKVTATSGEDTFEFIDPITIEMDEDFVGTIKVYYYKMPTLVEVLFDTETARQQEDTNYEFELDDRLLAIMPYGIARDLSRLDLISSYGSYWDKTYNEMIQRLDSRRSSGFVTFDGGVDF